MDVVAQEIADERPVEALVERTRRRGEALVSCEHKGDTDENPEVRSCECVVPESLKRAS